MDDIDLANDHAEMFRTNALRDHFAGIGCAGEYDGNTPRGGALPHGRAASGPHCCIDCGDPIAAARLKAAPHAVRCIECQTEFERDHGGES